MGRRPRKHKVITDSSSPAPDYLLGKPKTATFGNLSAEDFVWIGEKGTLEPDELLKDRGYEPEGALRLILGAIIDAHIVAGGPARARRIDAAEEALLWLKNGETIPMMRRTFYANSAGAISRDGSRTEITRSKSLRLRERFLQRRKPPGEFLI